MDFGISLDSVSECGSLCREVTATVTITGDVDAHSVRVRLELLSNGKRVRVNGEEYLEEYLGTIPAHESVARSVRPEIGFMDGLCARSKGVKAILTLASDERVKRVEEYLGAEKSE